MSKRNPSKGYFALDPAAGAVEISYRKGRSEFQKLGRPTPGGDLIQRPKTLEGNSELSHEAMLAFDHARQRPLFSEPGLYEVRATYRDMPNDANSLLESNTVSLKVGPAPDPAALDSWSKELTLLTEFDAGHSYAAAATITAATRFLERFPDSPYSPHLRDGLGRALQYKVDRNRATKEERLLYEKLQAERVPNQ